MIVSTLVYFKFGIPVEVKVVKQTVEFSPIFVFSPIFEITSGEHSGVTYKSKIGTSFGTHQKGTVLQAQYLKRFGLIESQGSLKFCGVIGALILLAVTVLNIYPMS